MAYERVSPGVYRDERGNIVKPQGGRVPRGFAAKPPTFQSIPLRQPAMVQATKSNVGIAPLGLRGGRPINSGMQDFALASLRGKKVRS